MSKRNREKRFHQPARRPSDYVFLPRGSTQEDIDQLVESYTKELTEAMVKNGVHPALIFAFQKTGRIVTDENKHLLSDDDLFEWEDAVDEYMEAHPGTPEL